MKIFSMFSGIGGFENGIEKAYEESWKHEQVGGVGCIRNSSGQYENQQRPSFIGYSEIDKYAKSVYRYHYPTHKNFGDATRIIPEELPDFDLLVGGFPCQAFSVAGKRGGFDDTRGTLFFEIARIARVKRPDYLLLENVKGLLSHDKGNTFATIILTLDELGYDCEWCVLNSKSCGYPQPVPQNRERVFIIGRRSGGQPRPQVFPIGEDGEIFIERQGQVSPTITSRYYKQGQSDPYLVQPCLRVGGGNNKGLIADSLQERDYKGGQLLAYSKSHRTGKSDADKRRKNYGQVEHRIKTDEFNTLSTGPGGSNQSTANYISEQSRIRRLTPTECARLQGFPDTWCDYGIDDKGNKVAISDTQKYKMYGNSVTTNVITAIMLKFMGEIW